jgi:hypothetical protein
VPFPPAPMLATAGQLPAEARGWVAEAALASLCGVAVLRVGPRRRRVIRLGEGY